MMLALGCSDPADPSAADGDGDDNTAVTAEGSSDGDGSTDPEGPDRAADEATADGSGTSDDNPAEVEERADVEGTVVSVVDGAPLRGAIVSVGEATFLTGPDGAFELVDVVVGEPLIVDRPVWRSEEVAWDPAAAEPLVVELEPIVVRALRVARPAATDPERFDELLDLVDDTSVNALVFDTKDETDTVLYDTEVAYAYEIDAVEPIYDPAALLAEARARDLYAITRIVTFEDETWAGADAEAKLAGAWVDAADRRNWDYPLDLAVEACEIGFDEIQFDYVRFPAGRTADIAAPLIPRSSDERAAVIEEFLTEARDRLHPMGCGVSAAIFGIVMSSPNDQGIGQTPETVSEAADAISPMLYPSHYNAGWLGFADPNAHPGPVVAHALDTGEGRVEPGTLVRPWLQGFGYNGAQVLAQIDEAEARGAGWIIWNAFGNYQRDWLPDP